MVRTTQPTVYHSKGSIQITPGTASPRDQGLRRRVLESLMIVSSTMEMSPTDKIDGRVVDKVLHVEVQ